MTSTPLRQPAARGLLAPALLAAVVASGAAQAQNNGAQPGTTGLRGLRPTTAPKVITLDEAFADAIQHSYDLRIAAARLDESEAQVKKAWSAVMPQISLSGQYNHNFPEQKFAFGDPKQFKQQALLFNSIADLTAAAAAANPDPLQQRAALEQADTLRQTAKDIANTKVTDIIITPADEVNGQLQITVPLFNGRALPLLQNAYAGVDITKIAAREARAAVIYGVARAYFQVVAAKRIVAITDQQVESSTAHKKLAQQQLDEGLGTHLSVQRAELDLARAEQHKEAAEGGVKLAKGALGSLIGVVEDFDVAEPPPVPALEQGKSADELLARAVQSRDDLRLEKQALAVADHNKLDAWMRFLPSVGLVATGRGTSNTGGLVSQPFTGVVGVQASLPIFDGGLTYGTIDEANAKLRQEVLKVRQLEQTIEEEVRGTLDDLTLKRTAVETADRVAALAHAQKKNVDDLFAAGAATGLDVTDASLAAFSADVDAARARFDLETARLGLAYAIGELRPDPDLGPKPVTGKEEEQARSYLDTASE